MNSTYCNYPNHHQNGNYHNNNQNGCYPNNQQTSMGCTRCDRNNCSSDVCKKFTYILPQAIYFQEQPGFNWKGCLSIKVSKFNNTVSYLPVDGLLQEERFVSLGINKKSLTFFQVAPPINLPGDENENENKLVNTSYDCDEILPLTIIIDVSCLQVVFEELIFETSNKVEKINTKPITLLLSPDQTFVTRILTLSDGGSTTDLGCIIFKMVELVVTYVYTITCNNISLNIASIIFNVKFSYPVKNIDDDNDNDDDLNPDTDIDINIDDGEDITANINIENPL